MTNRLDGVQALVQEFHDAFALASASLPTLDVPADLAALRLALIDEEVGELHDAVAAGDLVKIADALADVAYVTYGAALSYGIDLDAVVREVHRANLSKLDADGRPLYREDGKVLKSARYVPPDVAAVLARQAPMLDEPSGGGPAALG